MILWDIEEIKIMAWEWGKVSIRDESSDRHRASLEQFDKVMELLFKVVKKVSND